MASLGHIHKVATVRQAGRGIAADPHDDRWRGRTANLLTKWKAWHTPNIIRIGVVLPSHINSHDGWRAVADICCRNHAKQAAEKLLRYTRISMVRTCGTTKSIP